MSVINQNLLLTPEGYQISRSVRLRSSAGAWLSRTAGVPTSAYIWTVSFWTKIGTGGNFIGGGTTTPNYLYADFGALGLRMFNPNTGATFDVESNAIFRDPSAWYHVVVAFDSTQATASNRLKYYVNGVQLTLAVATYPALNSTFFWNQNGLQQRIGSNSGATGNYDGYLAEFIGVDGQALTPSSFGETDAVTGVWKPKKYAGTYGTNGFYLNFSDNSAATAAAIGKDYSGNGNNWTPNNISVTAGVTYDSMLDVPTMWADGGNGRGNYCTLNPLDKGSTVTNANLTTNSGAAHQSVRGSVQIPDSGLYYFEATVLTTTSASILAGAGLALSSVALTGSIAGTSNTWFVYCGDTLYINRNGSQTLVGGTTAAGSVLQIAVDMANSRAWFGINNTWYNGTSGTTGDPSTGSNPTFTSIASGVLPIFETYQDTLNVNFGQRPFAYTPPTGFKALNTQNLPDATIKKGNQYFDVNTWTGTGAAQSITNGGFQPDLVWVKSRSAVAWHNIVDAVRGLGNTLFSNATDAETAISNQVTALNSNGFTLGADTNGGTNYSGRTYVGWQWKESVTAGFDIVTYTGTGSTQNVSHSLGVAPKMMIVKRRDSSTNGDWFVYTATTGNTSALYLNLTAAVATGQVAWNSTTPTSSVFSVGNSTGVNASGSTYVAYLFAEVAGFSKFGSVSMNGSADGAFVFTGFLPKLVMLKRTDSTSNWIMWDTVRNTYNVVGEELYPNLSNAASTVTDLDILSNGFKMRNSGFSGTWIYAAWAEAPFKNSLAR